MFNNLSNKLGKIINSISNKSLLSKYNISDSIKKIKITLLESDVSLLVVDDIINRIKLRIKENNNISFTNSEQFINVIHQELVNTIKNSTKISLINKLKSMLLIGAPGSGKTTNLVKIGKLIQDTGKKVLITSIDIYRPAAFTQLKLLSKLVNIDYLLINNCFDSIDIIKQVLVYFKSKKYDMLLVDTAGKIYSNDYIDNIKEISSLLELNEIMLVTDITIGQDIVNVAKNINNHLLIDSIMITKMDSDAKGGAILSLKHIINSPIKFISTGEKINEIELFNPNKIIDRILGTVNTSSLNSISYDLSKKNSKIDNDFNLSDFLKQLKRINRISGINGILNKIPGITNIFGNIKYGINQIDNKFLIKTEAVINSMTNIERNSPFIIKSSHKKRISKGSGVSIQDINILLKQFFLVQKTVKKVKNNNFFRILKNMNKLVTNKFYRK
ncbi:MAG: signal recognition particle receptor subunit alpha [Candidatus Lightella neohaematopini]|nr:signal recognition particle receptor subunit alpha [Candidatus Lightella neohaematopini]MCV2528654.1 signal recognition particle receptor subunit alpha [Candidatus Lightella neohaematopini]